jgi:hypothetical protein
MNHKEPQPRESRVAVLDPVVRHLLGFLPLIPFWIMLWVHDMRGYSNAFQVASTEWDRISANYNLKMVIALVIGLGVFTGYAFALYQKDSSIRWLRFKLLVLALDLVAAFWPRSGH